MLNWLKGVHMGIVTYNFQSHYLRSNTTIAMILPEKPRYVKTRDFFESGKKYKVLWMLHGTYGDWSDWIRKTRIELYAAEHDLICVFPSALNSDYVSWPSFALGYDAENHLINELMPLVHNWFPASSRKEDNYIAGLSMGGRGALSYILKYPDLFNAGAILSFVPEDFRSPDWAEKYRKRRDRISEIRQQNRICNAGGEEEYKKINKLLGSENQQENNPVFLFIYSKYEPMSSVPVESGDGFCLWSSNLMKQETMETGKKSKQEQYYLLTNCIDRDNVYLALEKSLAKFEITRLAKDAAICSKVDPSQLNEKRRRLLECNYYHDALFVLHDDIFMTLINQRQFQSILQKYSSFTGVNCCRITSTRLTDFLRQFLWLDLTANELKLLIAGILNILDSAYYLDRDSFAIQVGKLFGEELSKIKCAQKHIVMLGGLLDSSSHLAYYLNDVKDKDSITIDGSVPNALRNAKEDDCICFFDDGAYSGKQVISIFQEFMGVPEMERTTNEHHVDELTAEQKDKLKQTKIVLAYLCFNPQSEEYIKSEFLKIGLTDITICYTHDLSRKIFDMLQPYFKTSEQQQIVKKYLQQIGCSILMSTKKLENGEFKPRWDEKRVTDAALGYNDAQQFVVFSTNIPTYSITPFWANGRLGDREWVGLFQRTNKD